MITLTDDSRSILAEIEADARDWDVDLEHDTAMEMADWDHIDVEGDVEAWETARAAERDALPFDGIPF